MTQPPRKVPANGPVLFAPGDEFTSVDPETLLPRLRLDPGVLEFDREQQALSVFVAGIEFDVDPDTAIGTGERLFAAGDDDAFGYVIERCGGWLHEWAAESVDRYTRIRPGVPLRSAVEELINGSGFGDQISDENTDQAWILPECET